MNQIEPLQRELREVSAVERTWDVVRSMVDDRTPRTWYTGTHGFERRHLGLTHPVDHVLVGLAVSRGEDPVDDAIRRNELQREAVEMARTMGDAIAGRIGDHGVVLLLAGKRRRALDLARRVQEVADRRYRLTAYFGVSAARQADPLSRSYEAALGAAESALARDVSIVSAEPNAAPRGESFRQLREQLDRAREERPQELAARFDRYLEAVALHFGYRMDAARGHLEAGFERLTEPLVRRGALEQRSFTALCDDLDRSADAARTTRELFAAYRRAVADVSDAMRKPLVARHDRSIRRALSFVRQHYAEPLSLASVARVGGFAPKYFSRLFAEHEKMPFERYVARLRLERAKHLLSSTALSAERVAELSGYGSPQYFCRVFREAVGVTPLEYRKGKDHKL
jgi:two-component system, response regulator YesN